ncbi:hypothetical protein Q5O24_06915 [Eubacteriaceae bacterium ES3]|nr:hypothetical protein Q5O24_06915 [Eubacteriaceae bacterium ES3]
MDNECNIQCIEKKLRAAIIAMDALTPTASEFLLREIPWESLTTDEILKLIKIMRTQPRGVPNKVISMEVK